MFEAIESLFQRTFALLFLILLFPLFIIFYLLIKSSSKGSFIFKQKRMGKNKKIFTIYKIRTMVENAEELKIKYLRFNEADGPVFKIMDDPRHTQIGKLLSYLGLDELPQLVNILKGDMSFVGPRPFPVEEALKVPKKYNKRFFVLPGITSSWVINGSHKLSFEQWMKLDLNYIKTRSLFFDLKIGLKTAAMILFLIYKASKKLVKG